MSDRSRLRLLQIAPSAVYVVLGAAFAWNYRFLLSSDQSNYLDLGQLWADGRFHEAVLGYWGPLLPWLLAPFLAAGVAPVLAGHAMAFVLGLVWVLAVQRLLARQVGPRRAALGALAGAVPAVLATGAAYSVLPDTLLSLLGIVLFRVLERDARKPRARLAIVAGVLCGLAFLAKIPAWLLFLPPTLLSLAWSRRRGRQPSAFRGLRHALLAATLAVCAFAATAAPWCAALSARAGRFTMGDATAVKLAVKYRSHGLPSPRVGSWLPYDGERWLNHNLWVLEPAGPVKPQWRFHARAVMRDAFEWPRFAFACPLAVLGFWVLFGRVRRRLRTRRRAWPLIVSAWVLGVLAATHVEGRYLLYVSPLLVLAAVRCPVPPLLRRLHVPRSRALLLCLLLAVLPIVRHWPRRPLGATRFAQTAELRRGLRGDERVWFNHLASGLPIAYLLDARVSRIDPALPGAAELVIWSEVAGRPEVGLAQADLRGYAPIARWQEEDGLVVTVLRAERE